MKTRAEIKSTVKRIFKENYWPIVGVYAVYMLIVVALSFIPAIGSLAALLVVPAIGVGFVNYFLRRYRGEQAVMSDLFDPFKRYGRVLGGSLWKALFLWLWSMLFIIPGIIKAFSYFCTEYILADSPNVKATDALTLSKKMMKGNKGKIFVANLSFIGWGLLGFVVYYALIAITVSPLALAKLSIVPSNPFSIMAYVTQILASMILAVLSLVAYEVLFLGPYTAGTMAGFYDEIKKDALERGVVSLADFGEETPIHTAEPVPPMQSIEVKAEETAEAKQEEPSSGAEADEPADEAASDASEQASVAEEAPEAEEKKPEPENSASEEASEDKAEDETEGK